MHSEEKPIDGTVLMVNAAGLAFAVEPETGREYSFTFDKIRNYRGQSSTELGLKTGSRVRLFVNERLVSAVELQTKDAA